MKWLIIPVLYTMVSCKQPASLSPAEQAAMKDSIRLMFRNYSDDVRALGLTAEFNYLDRSEDFFWLPPGYGSPISYDSVVAVLRHNAPMFRSVDNRYDTLRIIPMSRELASYTAKLHSTVTDTMGNTTTVILIETGVLIKRKDGWKLLSGQTAVLP